MIATETKIDRFDALFAEVCGGEDVVAAMGRRLDGETWQSIAASLDTSRQLLQHRVRKAKVKLRKLKLLTPELDKKL